ncbi:UPF0271 protein [Paraoerskovia marina]|uniref:UPF0271 protein n=2 Tax=Paraoerskovia marina TaxID=545619 RepID=A0A1H1RPE3_9CELL|nr:UPF0271 protein [Paraoerskovia marina]
MAVTTTMDLNADLAEGFGRWTLTDDAALLDVVTSANVACGFHAGDAPTMRRVCDLAVERGVSIGAHVAYRDLAGFGRRSMDVPAGDLAAEVAYQIGALNVFARAAGARVAYVKPHGALYNRAAWDVEQAVAVVEGVGLAGGGGPLPVLGQPGSALLVAAERAGHESVPEGFTDRGYRADGTLVPRSEAGALLTDEKMIVARTVALATGQPVPAADGTPVRVDARSLCVHGDSPGAVDRAVRLREALEADGVALRAFA